MRRNAELKSDKLSLGLSGKLAIAPATSVPILGDLNFQGPTEAMATHRAVTVNRFYDFGIGAL
jgi:hypothetical protein